MSSKLTVSKVQQSYHLYWGRWLMCYHLPWCNFSSLDSSLQLTEQCFNWVEPRTILGIEKYVHSFCFCQSDDPTMMVDPGVIKKQHYTWTFKSTLSSEIEKNLVKEVLKDWWVHSSFNELCSNNCLLSDGSKKTDRIWLRSRPLLRQHRQSFWCKAITS